MRSDRLIPILYEDDFFVVFDKPSGVLVIPSPKKEKNVLTRIVNDLFASKEYRLHPCHRLDRETSGVIIFAKGKKNQQIMMEEFHKGQVRKTYVAFVRGKVKQKKGEMRSVISDFHSVGNYKNFLTARKFLHSKSNSDPAKSGEEFSCKKRKTRGKLAITKFKLQSAGTDFSVVDVYPETGRTNQIRIHFRNLGHPLLGERIYAFRKDFSVDFKRLALHARTIDFRHPVLRKNLTVTANLPQDMADFLKKHS